MRIVSDPETTAVVTLAANSEMLLMLLGIGS